MKGIYEQQWQNALAGASVQPTEALWDNIAGNLDGQRGRHGWVTILLIAATVTLAFAFPLTIGNSSFEIQDTLNPNIAQNTGSNINDIPGESNDNIASLVVEDDQEEASVEQNTIHGVASAANREEKSAQVVTKSDDKATILAKNDQKNIVQASSGSEADLESGSSATGYGMADFNLGYTLSLADINDYYFIPYYLPEIISADRGLLAALNFGTGSLGEGGGFNGLGLLNADMSEASVDLSSSIGDQRSESPGSTFYFGTGVELPLGKRWSLIAGLGYLTQNASGTSNVVLEEGNVSKPLSAYDPIGPGTVFLAESYSYAVTNSYINVPLTIKYPFVNRKIKFRGGIGLSTDFMISHKINSEAYGQAKYSPGSMDYKTVVLAGLINLDLSYSVNSEYAIALEGGIRKGFTSIDQNGGYYPSSFTIGLVFFYKIH